MINTPDILKKMAETYAERNAVYGDNFRNVGRIMMILFPEGLNLESESDFTRWHIFELIVVKLTRYSINFKNGGHPDSVHDAAVYNAMLEMLDYELTCEDEEEHSISAKDKFMQGIRQEIRNDNI